MKATVLYITTTRSVISGGSRNQKRGVLLVVTTPYTLVCAICYIAMHDCDLERGVLWNPWNPPGSATGYGTKDNCTQCVSNCVAK